MNAIDVGVIYVQFTIPSFQYTFSKGYAVRIGLYPSILYIQACCTPDKLWQRDLTESLSY